MAGMPRGWKTPEIEVKQGKIAVLGAISQGTGGVPEPGILAVVARAQTGLWINI